MAELGITGRLVCIRLGLSALALWTEPFTQTTWQDQGLSSDALINGGTLQELNSLVAGSYAVNFWKGLSAGTNVNVLYHRLSAKQTSLGFQADLGLAYRLPILGVHRFAITVQNILPAMNKKTDTLDPNLRLSTASDFVNNVHSSMEFSLKDVIGFSHDFKADSGMPEISPKTEFTFDARLGADFLHIFSLYGLGGQAMFS